MTGVEGEWNPMLNGEGDGAVTEEITLRRAVPRDREAVARVESQATPNLSYLPQVFDLFLNDLQGDFSVAEVGGRVVACAKFTVLPDGSAWLEALRVLPDYQGLGIGKRFYRNFFAIAEDSGISTLRMYTNIANEKSKGLAERFGFQWVATYRGAQIPTAEISGTADSTGFQPVTDPRRAADLLMPHCEEWTGFLVMNRTFFPFVPATCARWATEGKIYEDPGTGDVIVLGARFMPKQALHIAFAEGEPARWLHFARRVARASDIERIQCMYPPRRADVEAFLLGKGFRPDAYDCIVMEATIQR